MRHQICRLIIALGCLAGVSAPAMASLFNCPPGSFLSAMDNNNFLGTGPFGEVCVTLTRKGEEILARLSRRNRAELRLLSRDLRPTFLGTGAGEGSPEERSDGVME